MEKMLSFCTLFLIGLVSVGGQSMHSLCEKTLTNPWLRSTEAHCSCMQKLLDFGDPLFKLTVNQTGCSKHSLLLNWNQLQTYIGVEVLVFSEANITFSKEISTMNNCSVKEVSFIRSNFIAIPRHAFSGLHNIEIIRFLGSKIGSIESKAFSGFHRLKTIEFADASINRIATNAFADLPQLKELAFIRSSIVMIESNAIMLKHSPALPNELCPPTARMSYPFVYDLMSRDLSSIQNVTLPEYGPRIFFFQSIVTIIESRAIVANLFAYIIFGGNDIGNLESRAVEAELYNNCDISALLLIGNTIRWIESGAIAGLTGHETNALTSMIALYDNTFGKVENKGFLINDTLTIFTVQNNKFKCDCGYFEWILSDEDSEIQNDLEKQLIEKSFCTNTEENLEDFLTNDYDIEDCRQMQSTTTFIPISSSPSTSLQKDVKSGNSRAHSVSPHFLSLLTLKMIYYYTA